MLKFLSGFKWFGSLIGILVQFHALQFEGFSEISRYGSCTTKVVCEKFDEIHVSYKNIPNRSYTSTKLSLDSNTPEYL